MNTLVMPTFYIDEQLMNAFTDRKVSVDSCVEQTLTFADEPTLYRAIWNVWEDGDYTRAERLLKCAKEKIQTVPLVYGLHCMICEVRQGGSTETLPGFITLCVEVGISFK